MTAKQREPVQINPADQRKHPRRRASFDGQLFVPAETLTMDCTVVDLSVSGAGVLCDDVPPLSTFVVLDIDGFGRYEAVTVRYVNGVLGLRFQCSDEKRRRLVSKLDLCIGYGMTVQTGHSGHDRSSRTTVLHFVRPNGEEVSCEVLATSDEEMSLKTRERPPVNELIQIGLVYGRVERHHEQGFSLKLFKSDDVWVLT